ncbi:hypothetical protein MD484_g8817, partial [Candolleomyces efflorescens]
MSNIPDEPYDDTKYTWGGWIFEYGTLLEWFSQPHSDIDPRPRQVVAAGDEGNFQDMWRSHLRAAMIHRYMLDYPLRKTPASVTAIFFNNGRKSALLIYAYVRLHERELDRSYLERRVQAAERALNDMGLPPPEFQEYRIGVNDVRDILY